MTTANKTSADASPTEDRKRLVGELVAAETRARRATGAAQEKLDTARAQLAEAAQAYETARTSALEAEGELNTAALLHGRRAESIRNQLRASAPAAIGEFRTWIAGERDKVTRQTPRNQAALVAGEKRAGALIAANNVLDGLELEALPEESLSERLAELRATIDRASGA